MSLKETLWFVVLALIFDAWFLYCTCGIAKILGFPGVCSVTIGGKLL